jgi:hypothetical protein
MKNDITRRRADRCMLEGVLRPFLLFAPVSATEGIAGDGSAGEVSVYKKEDVSPLTVVWVTETALTALTDKYCSTNCIALNYETPVGWRCSWLIGFSTYTTRTILTCPVNNLKHFPLLFLMTGAGCLYAQADLDPQYLDFMELCLCNENNYN